MFFRLWLLVLFLILLGSLLPGRMVVAVASHLPTVTDKHIHFAEYAAWAFLSLLAFGRTRAGLLVALSGIPLGIALEFAQRLIPGRGFEPADMLANTLGVLTGLALASTFRKVSNA